MDPQVEALEKTLQETERKVVVLCTLQPDQDECKEARMTYWSTLNEIVAMERT